MLFWIYMLSLGMDVSIQKTHTTIIYLITSKALALVLGSWLPSDPHWWTNPAWNLVPDGCDITSGLLDDITMTMVTLAMGHGQMSLLGYLMTSQNKASYLGYWLTSPWEQWPWQHNADVCTSSIATHRPDHANQRSTGHIEESNLSTFWYSTFTWTIKTNLPVTTLSLLFFFHAHHSWLLFLFFACDGPDGGICTGWLLFFFFFFPAQLVGLV